MTLFEADAPIPLAGAIIRFELLWPRSANRLVRCCAALVSGATSVIRHMRAGTSPWLEDLLKRKPRKLAAVALANKIARIVWKVMVSGESYRTTVSLPAAAVT